MEVESAPSQLVSSPTLESFEDYMAVYARFVPERLKVEKRLSEIKEYGKQKRVKKEMPRYPERVPLGDLLYAIDTLGFHDGGNEMAGHGLYGGAETF